ncbi:MAG: hypothetical protein JSS96_03610 [Bacteroidetes bacterium]|nr:hypothetical protein [Bacteroidota bacterium]
MARNFSKRISVDGKMLLAVLLPEMHNDGMYYEVNINGYPRFHMSWSALGRYDLAPNQEVKLPYQLILAVSDLIEEIHKKDK